MCERAKITPAAAPRAASDATHLAALAAASFGLGHRVADTVRCGEFRESVVRTTTGCVVTYPAGRSALLTLVTVSPGEDLEALHEEARAVARRAGTVVDRRGGGVGATAVAEAHGPLAVRTPMATLPAQLRRPSRPTWRRPPI